MKMLIRLVYIYHNYYENTVVKNISLYIMLCLFVVTSHLLSVL